MTYSDLLFASVLLPLSVLFILFDRSAEYKNLILLLFSMLFAVWGRSFSCLLIFASVAVDYLLAFAVEGMLKKNRNNAVLYVAVDFIWNAFLFVWLTKNFLFANSGIFHLRNAVIPVGTAFYTLKNFSYVYDVYSGKIRAEKNILCLLVYSAAYPFLLAGPVVRYGDIEPQIRSRRVTTNGLSCGLTGFSIGLAKTVLVVPVLEKLYESGLDPSEPTLVGAWAGIIAFFGAAYFTFTGLSDMGTGIARMNGFDVSVNYTRITTDRMLGGLVRSYNTSMIDFFSEIADGFKKFPARQAALIVLSAAGAFFYSEGKLVLVSALLIGLILAAENSFGYDNIEKIPKIIKLPVTAVLGVLLFSCFAFGDFTEWKAWLSHLAGIGNEYRLSTSVKYTIINNCFLLLAAAVCVSPAGRFIKRRLDDFSEGSPRAYSAVRTLRTICVFLLLASSFIVLTAETAA